MYEYIVLMLKMRIENKDSYENNLACVLKLICEKSLQAGIVYVHIFICKYVCVNVYMFIL